MAMLRLVPPRPLKSAGYVFSKCQSGWPVAASTASIRSPGSGMYMTPPCTRGVPSKPPAGRVRTHMSLRAPTFCGVIWFSGLKPQLFSVRRHISQSAGSGVFSMASVTGT